MKKISFILVGVVFASVAFVSSCTKEKVPVQTVTADCTDTIHFATQIAPLIQNNCISCHDAGGSMPTLTNYSEISANATAVLGSLNGSPQLMPQGGPALNDTLIQQFTCWINQGKLDN
jgi:uncharacterized membrane protein